MVFIFLLAPVIAIGAGTVYVVRRVEKRRQKKRAARGIVTYTANNDLSRDQPITANNELSYEPNFEPPAYSASLDKQDSSLPTGKPPAYNFPAEKSQHHHHRFFHHRETRHAGVTRA